MKTLTIRAFSALAAVLVIVGLIYFYDVQGLQILCYIVPIFGGRELSKILFRSEDSLLVKSAFAVITIANFALAVNFPNFSTLAFACLSILFCCIAIICERRFQDLTSLFLFQTKCLLGFFYVSMLPALAYQILMLPNGKVWFLTMLAIVFSGDTFAYLTGMLWGKKKLLVKISPKKTIVGALGGLFGSAGAGALAGLYFLPHVTLAGLIAVSVGTGIIAQFGDLFESMLKRVANVKDSGSIMPGHGGILDRLDGVLFGAPILLAGALLLENLF